MGVRGEIFSSRIILPNRTYFFNVKENRMGDLYLNIVESKNRETGGFDRQSVILFADDLQEFLKNFDEALKVMEKAVREKRHGAANRDEKPYRKEKPDDDEKDRKTFTAERKGRYERDGNKQPSTGDKYSKNFKTDRGYDRKPSAGRFEGSRREGGRFEGSKRSPSRSEGAKREGGGRFEGSKRSPGRSEDGKREGGRRVVVKSKKNFNHEPHSPDRH